jgi:hypothetical protein
MPFGLLIGFINNLQFITTINYNTVTHSQSLHANLFTLSAVVFTYSISLNHTLQIKPSILTLHLHTADLLYSAVLLVSVRSFSLRLTWTLLHSLRNCPRTHCLDRSRSRSHIATDGQSVKSLGVEPHLGLMTRYFLLFDSYGLVFFCGAPSLMRGWVCLLSELLPALLSHLL